MTQLSATAAAMVAPGKGILAADESISTMSARLEAAGVAASEENRRAYRELLVSTPGLAEGISGVILCDETFHQRVSAGAPFPQAMRELGLLPGIKVDTGTAPLRRGSTETVTEGLDGLRARLAHYADAGAAFAKWRAVIRIGPGTPSTAALRANGHALARYARLCQDEGLVPIVEPEVLMTGTHSISRCAWVSSAALLQVVSDLVDLDVDLDGVVLKPNMVVPGIDSGQYADPEQVARETVDVLTATVPAEVAGIAFLSGGQPAAQATANLAAMQELSTPWPLTFSFGRALVDAALAAWAGQPALVAQGQRALAHRVSCNTAALQRRYTPELEREDAA